MKETEREKSNHDVALGTVVRKIGAPLEELERTHGKDQNSGP